MNKFFVFYSKNDLRNGLKRDIEGYRLRKRAFYLKHLNLDWASLDVLRTAVSEDNYRHKIFEAFKADLKTTKSPENKLKKLNSNVLEKTLNSSTGKLPRKKILAGYDRSSSRG